MDGIDPLKTLLAICLEHPDYDGSLDADDLPAGVMGEAWKAIQESGDNLSIIGVNAFGKRLDGHTVVIMPLESGGWRAKVVSQEPPKPQWSLPTSPELEQALRSLVGGKPKALQRLREVLEDVWQAKRIAAEVANSSRDAGPWESVPDRWHDDVLAESLLRYKAEPSR